jgi:hypothetical protein
MKRLIFFLVLFSAVFAQNVVNPPSPGTTTVINGVVLSSLGTGLLKNTTGTGVPSIATAADIPPIPTTAGTALSITLPNGFAQCTATCIVTVPPPTAAGDQFCAWTRPGVTTATMTLSAIPGVQYGNTAGSAYGTVNATATVTAAGGDKICMIAPDTTHWDTLTSGGTWTMN